MPKKNKKSAAAARKTGRLASGPSRSALSLPYAVSSVYTTSPPVFRSTPNSIVITHSEMILEQVVPKENTLIAATVSLNPGLGVFSWLSGIARCFEKYRFHDLSFHFQPLLSTSTAGAVLMAVDFDAADTAPLNLVQMSSYIGCTNAPIWTNSSAHYNRRMLGENWFFVRTGLLSPNLDIKTYDVGNFLVGTSGVGMATTGTVRVSYTVEFTLPQTDVESANSNSANIVADEKTASPAKPLGENPKISGALPIRYDSQTGRLIFETPGDFLVTGDVNGTGITGGPSYVPGNGATGVGDPDYPVYTAVKAVGQFLVTTPIGGYLAPVIVAATTLASHYRIVKYPKKLL